MIHTNELMLGNWVEYATGLNGDKRSIPMYVTGIFSDTVYLNFDGNEGDVFEEEEENLLGIPITAELLEKCGFGFNKTFNKYTHKERVSDTYLRIGGLGANVSFDGERYSVHCGYQTIGFLTFLHELQNAYFMLTKKHLEIKL